MDHPELCRIEYWSPLAADWWVGHAGINLMNPSKYLNSVNEKGRIARLVIVDTGEVIYAEGGDLL